ncbi:MAG: chemotaxis protein CheA [Spirochaetaceae bacterium]
MSVNNILKKLNVVCTNFYVGDLLALSEIQDYIVALQKEELLDCIVSAFDEIIIVLNNFHEVEDQESFVKKITELLILIESNPEDIEISIEDLDFNSYIKEPVIEVDTRFDNIIQETDMLEKFYDEATEHLNSAQVVLVDLEYDPENVESINTIFRAFHTIKGSAAFLGVKNVEDVAHVVENMLSLVRDGKLKISGQLIDVIFYGIKFLEDLFRVLPSCQYDIPRVISSYKTMDTQPLIALVEKIVKESSKRKLGEILEDMGKIDSSIVGQILQKQETEGKRFGDILIEEEIITPKDIDDAVKIQKKEKIQSSFVKVHASKLNDLVDMVGELVVTQSMISQSSLDLENSNNSLDKNIDQLITISRSIKNIVLGMGMVSIGEVFNKLKVVIRNASRDVGRVINVQLIGEDTELDRNLIEAIYDPLVHMVRNSVDHGIEDGTDRVAKGKSDVGHITISATHKGNGIEVTIEDDGKGIDKDIVIKKALAKELIKEEEVSWYHEHEREVFMLLFEPGFSTKENVSELSGRGVGLDVVKKNIESVRGKIDIQSTPDEGTKFTLKLPLTLAIIDGFVTQVDHGKYIFPFSSISEIIVPKEGQIDEMDSGELILKNRDQFIPVFQANKIINEAGLVNHGDVSMGVVLIITHEGSQYGIGVDKVLGKQEIVIKSLNEVLRNMELFSGGTIFGDGSIGFVVDIDSFLEKCN